MADIVERLRVLIKAVSAKVWNGLADGLAVVGNPCAVVDVQKTISKRARRPVDLCWRSPGSGARVLF